MTTTINLPKTQTQESYYISDLIHGKESAFVYADVLYLIIRLSNAGIKTGFVISTKTEKSYNKHDSQLIVDYFCDITINVKRK